MSVPPVTIGLPVYNGENYLAAAIGSIREQTFADFELIISDNASTDATEEIARSAARDDPRIRYHRHEVNEGGPANYNFAFSQSESEFFMWHAHDDLLAPAFLELAHQRMIQCPGAAVVFSPTMLIGPDGEEKGIKPRPDGFLAGSSHERLRAVISARHIDVVLFGLMRRSTLQRTRLHGAFKGGDRVLVAELALLGDLVELDQVLFFNRDHPDRYTRQIPKDRDGRRSKTAWWDPSREDKISMARWTGLRQYFAAVRTHPLSSGERARCYGSVLASLFDNRMYFAKQLIREVTDALPLVAGRLAQAIRK